jgi:hypothetical protein
MQHNQSSRKFEPECKLKLELSTKVNQTKASKGTPKFSIITYPGNNFS